MVTVDANEGKLYEFNSATASTVVVSLHREGAAWFFKLRGDKDVVAGAKASFTDFLNSVHFTSDVGGKESGDAGIHGFLFRQR